MMKYMPVALAFGLLSSQATAQYPMVDQLAAKIVAKYQSATCEQLAAERSAPADPQKAAMKDRAGALLQSDAGARLEFVNKVAPTVVNKMIECGLIP
jgi:hypothetical protein